jgi:hypothetical protein
MNPFKKHNELRKAAASIKNWYMVNGKWEHLTQAEATKRAREVIAQSGEFRKATVDEELEQDGI